MKAIAYYDHKGFKKALFGFTRFLGIVSIGLIAWYFFHLSLPPSSLQKAIVVFPVAMFIIFLWTSAIAIFLNERRKRLEADFRSYFSFGLPADPGQRIILQRRVNGRLKELADAFQENCAGEAKFLENVASKSVASYDETETALAKLTDIRVGINGAKKLFWNAHGIAKRARFEVFRKHAEYLDLR